MFGTRQVKYDCGTRGKGCGATESDSHPAPDYCHHGAPKRLAPDVDAALAAITPAEMIAAYREAGGT